MFTLKCLIIATVFNLGCHCENYDLPEKVFYDLNSSEILFQNFVLKYDKQYSTEEFAHRYRIFQDNLKRINALNEKHESTVFGITHFADLTFDELKKYASCFYNISDAKPMTFKKLEYPDELDYRKQNLVSEIKNQGYCGSCYIFGAIGDIEGQYAKRVKKVVSLSEQYPLDCGGDDNISCAGGFSSWVMKWLSKTPGPLTTADCPYNGRMNNCTEDPNKGVVRVKPVNETSVSTTQELKTLLTSHGPLATALVVTFPMFYYKGGVFIPERCTGPPNHEVTLIGYGVDKTNRYWLMKNSWGEDWGEKGYFRIIFNACEVGSYLTPSELV